MESARHQSDRRAVMMMLTEDTADHLRVSNRLDPKQSIRADPSYFSDHARHAAGYGARADPNLAGTAAQPGMGHMNGARRIAEA